MIVMSSTFIHEPDASGERKVDLRWHRFGDRELFGGHEAVQAEVASTRGSDRTAGPAAVGSASVTP